MAAMGGFRTLALGVSTVCYPIPEQIFDYVSTVRSATAGTCQEETFDQSPGGDTPQRYFDEADRRDETRLLALGRFVRSRLGYSADWDFNLDRGRSAVG